MILQNGGKHAWNCQGGTVQGVNGFGFPIGTPKTDVGPTRLKVREVTAAGHFKPPFLTSSPHLEVELLGMRKTDVSGANQEYPVGKLEFLK